LFVNETKIGGKRMLESVLEKTVTEQEPLGGRQTGCQMRNLVAQANHLP